MNLYTRNIWSIYMHIYNSLPRPVHMDAFKAAKLLSTLYIMGIRHTKL